MPSVIAPLTILFTFEQIAERHGVTRDAVAQWRANGELIAINVNRFKNSKRPTWRVRPEDLEAFELSRRSVKPQPESRPRKAIAKTTSTKNWF